MTPREEALLESESDPRILRGLVRMAADHIERLKKIIAALEAEKAREAQLSFALDESFKVLKKKFFDKSSEKLSDRERDRLNSDPEILLHSQNVVPPVKEKAVQDLPREERIYEATDEELILASKELGLTEGNPGQWEKVEGLFDQSVEIEIIERSYKKIVHKRQKYRLKPEVFKELQAKSSFGIGESSLGEIKSLVLIAAKGPVKLLPGASYSIPFAVSTVADKYLNHIPLERQCRVMESLGLKNMRTQTLFNLCKTVALYLEPLVEKIKAEVISHGVVHSDETPWPINNKKDSDGYMWILSNHLGSVYRFEPTRSGKVIRESLKGFSGTVVTDGYGGYAQFREGHDSNQEGVVLAMCHAHARRNFFEIRELYPEVDEYLKLYSKLFEFERQARDFEQLAEIRKVKSAPIWERMRAWLIEIYPDARPQSRLRSAIEYSLKFWRELSVFLSDPRVPLTNNDAERAIRQSVMGRKNFYGSRSIDGADVAAIFYTVIESCKKVEIDPRDYLLKTVRAAAQGQPLKTPLEIAKSIRQ